MTGIGVDVAVVGGGPAGLVAAAYAAKKGLIVNVFERKREIGIPVRCGEYLPEIREIHVLLPRAAGIPELFSVPDEAVANRCRGIRVFSPRGKSWEFEFRGNVLHRHVFERLLAEKAVHAGVELVLDTHAKLYEEDDGCYVGRSRIESVKAKVVIAADGFPSEICQSSRLRNAQYSTPYGVSTVVQYRMEGVRVSEEVIEMYFDPKYAPGGFVWIIPKGGGIANVGLGARTPFTHGNHNVRSLLDAFVAHHPTASHGLSAGRRVATIADLLPVNGPVLETANEAVMAVGDAAGMVIPTTGGGIPTAMVAGKLAGEIAADHLTAGVPLQSYEGLWKKQIGRELLTALRLRRAADMVMGEGSLMHGVLSMLGVNGVRSVITCRVPWRMGCVLNLVQTLVE